MLIITYKWSNKVQPFKSNNMSANIQRKKVSFWIQCSISISSVGGYITIELHLITTNSIHASKINLDKASVKETQLKYHLIACWCHLMTWSLQYINISVEKTSFPYWDEINIPINQKARFLGRDPLFLRHLVNYMS